MASNLWRTLRRVSSRCPLTATLMNETCVETLNVITVFKSSSISVLSPSIAIDRSEKLSNNTVWKFLHAWGNGKVKTEAQGAHPQCRSLFSLYFCFGVRYYCCTNGSVLPSQHVLPCQYPSFQMGGEEQFG